MGTRPKMNLRSVSCRLFVLRDLQDASRQNAARGMSRLCGDPPSRSLPVHSSSNEYLSTQTVYSAPQVSALARTREEAK